MTHEVSARDFESFRERARALLAQHVPPSDVVWRDELAPQANLFAGSGGNLSAKASGTREERAPVPRRFMDLARRAVLHRGHARFSLPYRVLFRITRGERRLLDDTLDDDVRTLEQRSRAVWQDEHRMHAFLRFRATELNGEPYSIAWYAPDHYVLCLTAPFFARRFANMRWCIVTPDESVSWNGEMLTFGPGAPRSAAPREDQIEPLFRIYYQATSNPARINPALFAKHVPHAFRREMPELRASDLTLAPAAARPSRCEAAAAHVPRERELPVLRAAAAACAACPLSGPATQTVFGAGDANAALMLVGEQPGDQEDLSGVPFVGPAGHLLDEALQKAQIARDDLYITNAVKHFHHERVGSKKRLHRTPEWRHIEACRPWLSAELEVVKPRVIVCLGASAGQSFVGRRFTLLKNRGRVFDTPHAEALLVTWHPSALLRMEEVARTRALSELVGDLRHAAELARLPAYSPPKIPNSFSRR